MLSSIIISELARINLGWVAITNFSKAMFLVTYCAPHGWSSQSSAAPSSVGMLRNHISPPSCTAPSIQSKEKKQEIPHSMSTRLFLDVKGAVL